MINVENGFKIASNQLTEEQLFPSKKDIEVKIAEYNAIPTKNVINESHFLYDKSFLIKKTFITAINKKLSLYGSFSYFSGKTAKEELKLLDVSNFIKLYIEKRSLKINLKFQLAHIDGRNPKKKDKKIHNFSITRLGRKRKLNMSQPIETIIIRAQQNLDAVRGLNPIQIEIEDDRIINIFKKYETVLYKITPLDLLFPASMKNDRRQISITGKELNGVKKSILNGKMYGFIVIIDFDKISNWTEIKGQSIWVSVSFKDQKEINNNSHLCFPFVTRSFNDLTSFSIYLQDDQNKEIEFNTGEQKISILNFQTEVYLR